MKQIWKWPLSLQDIGTSQELRVPAGTEFLSAHLQGSQICLWGMVDPQCVRTERRLIEVWGTGHDMPPAVRSFIGTIVISTGLVFHVFEWVQTEGKA